MAPMLKTTALRNVDTRDIFTRYGILIVLVALLIIAGLISPVFYRSANIANVLQQASALGVISIGQTIVILAGGIDLSVASILATSCVFAAAMMAGKNSMVIPISLFCILIGFLSGILNGLIVTKRNAPPFIVTLGTALILQGIRFVYTKGAPFGTIPPWLRVMGRGRIAFFPVSVIIFLSLAVLVAIFLKRSPYGRKVYAVGDNKRAAYLSGINVNWISMSTYILSGVFASLGGLVLAGYLGFGDNWAGKGFELDSIAAVVVGGTSLVGGSGSVAGTVIGVLLMTVVFNLVLLAGLPYQAQLIVKGLIIAGAVAFYSTLGKRD